MMNALELKKTILRGKRAEWEMRKNAALVEAIEKGKTAHEEFSGNIAETLTENEMLLISALAQEEFVLDRKAESGNFYAIADAANAKYVATGTKTNAGVVVNAYRLSLTPELQTTSESILTINVSNAVEAEMFMYAITIIPTYEFGVKNVIRYNISRNDDETDIALFAEAMFPKYDSVHLSVEEVVTVKMDEVKGMTFNVYHSDKLVESDPSYTVTLPPYLSRTALKAISHVLDYGIMEF